MEDVVLLSGSAVFVLALLFSTSFASVSHWPRGSLGRVAGSNICSNNGNGNDEVVSRKSACGLDGLDEHMWRDMV